MSKILVDRPYATEEEARLHETLNRHLGAALSSVDATTKLRSAPGVSKRLRGVMRRALEEAAHAGMDALTHSLNPEPKKEP